MSQKWAPIPGGGEALEVAVRRHEAEVLPPARRRPPAETVVVFLVVFAAVIVAGCVAALAGAFTLGVIVGLAVFPAALLTCAVFDRRRALPADRDHPWAVRR